MSILFLVGALGIERLEYLDSLSALIDKYSSTYGLDAHLMRAIAWVGSRYYHRTCPSIYGSIGVMDVSRFHIPAPPVSITVDCGNSTMSINDVKGYVASSLENNVEYATRLMKKFLDECSGNLACALEEFGGKLFARDVLRVYRNGLSHYLSISPHEHVEIPKISGVMDADCSPQPEFSFVNYFVPADASNYTDADRPNDYPISYVIIHTTQGSYSGTVNWFQNPSANVSAHYVVNSEYNISDDGVPAGEITQMVCHKDVAWHAGNWNYNTWSVGIEHEGYVDENGWYTDSLYKRSALITRGIGNVFGVPLDRQHIIGHYEVPGADHTDPGPLWDWKLYMGYVNGLPVGDTLLDEVSENFTRYGNYDSWWFDTLGYGGHYFWTYAWRGERENWAEWRPLLPFPGRYQVSVYIPDVDTVLSYVRYIIGGRGGISTVWLDQNLHRGEWVVLDTAEFDADSSGYVLLTDTTSSSQRAFQKVVFDAMSFRYLGPMDGCVDRIVDDGNPGWNASSGWNISSYSGYAGDYRYAFVNSGDSAVYNPQITCPGGYRIYAWVRRSSNRTTSAEYRIFTGAGNNTVYLNQYSPVMDTVWLSMGGFCLDSSSKVILYSSASDGDVVISDAIKFEYDPSMDCTGLSTSEEKDGILSVKPGRNGIVVFSGDVIRLPYSIYSVDGRLVEKGILHLKPGSNYIGISRKGIYIIRLGERTYRIPIY